MDPQSGPNRDDDARTALRRRRLRRLLWIVAAWGVAAYLIAPRLWEIYFHRHPDYPDVAHLTETSDRNPGDPVNVALVGSDTDIVRAMGAAGWFPTDPITLKTSLRIAADSVLRRPDEDAPVSRTGYHRHASLELHCRLVLHQVRMSAATVARRTEIDGADRAPWCSGAA